MWACKHQKIKIFFFFFFFSLPIMVRPLSPPVSVGIRRSCPRLPRQSYMMTSPASRSEILLPKRPRCSAYRMGKSQLDPWAPRSSRCRCRTLGMGLNARTRFIIMPTLVVGRWRSTTRTGTSQHGRSTANNAESKAESGTLAGDQTRLMRLCALRYIPS